MNFLRGSGYCLRERFQDIAVPTLVLWGESDRVLYYRVLSKGNAARFYPSTSGCELETTGYCRHILEDSE